MKRDTDMADMPAASDILLSFCAQKHTLQSLRTSLTKVVNSLLPLKGSAWVRLCCKIITRGRARPENFTQALLVYTNTYWQPLATYGGAPLKES